MKQRILLLLCLLGYTLGMLAEGYTAENLPMPYLQDVRRHTSNPDGILSSEAVARIDSALYQLEQQQGVQALVIAVKRVEGGDCYNFGMEVARKYRPGSKKQDSGLIFVLATEDRGYYILTGEGLEGVLPDAICKRIENRFMLPNLKNGDWNNALLQSVQAACGYIEGDPSLTANQDDEDDEAALIALLFLFFILSIGGTFVVVANRKKTKCPRCGKHMLQRMHSTQISKKNGIITKNVTYVCRHCGHTLTRVETTHDDDYFNGGGPLIIGGGGRSGFGGSFGGGGFGGGSFGGGSFGGGGAGGRF